MRLVVLGIDYRVVVKSVEWLETVVMMVTIENGKVYYYTQMHALLS